MAAPAKQHMLGIDPKMYRHFAVLTLVITSIVAVFANGEKKKALEPAAEVHKAEAEEDAGGEAGVLDRFNRGEKAPESASSAPPPSAGVAGPEPGPLDPSPGGGSVMSIPAIPARVVVDQRALLSLPTPQRVAYMRALARRGASVAPPAIGAPGGPTERQMENLIAASRERSGSASPEFGTGD